MLSGVEEEGPVLESPAGEGAGPLLDVALAVVADAEGEELHHLAREVLVGVRLPVRRAVEIGEHRRVTRHALQQL